MRYSGNIGFAIPIDKGYGVIEDSYIEKNYIGDVLRTSNRWVRGTGINDNLTTSNQISIIADEFMNANFQHIKYADWMGTKWKVESIEPKFPRLILQLGGYYEPAAAT